MRRLLAFVLLVGCSSPSAGADGTPAPAGPYVTSADALRRDSAFQKRRDIP
jgi:hypothetical protein